MIRLLVTDIGDPIGPSEKSVNSSAVMAASNKSFAKECGLALNEPNGC